MTREELEHAIRAACEVADDDEVYVFGSQAILGQHPHPPPLLMQSMEADIAPKNKPENVDLIDGALGELSDFHESFGFYVHGVSLKSARFPRGWKSRCVRVRNPNTNERSGLCVDAHDLAASKLVAFRDKDKAFVRILVVNKLVIRSVLRERVLATVFEAARKKIVLEWLGNF